MKANNIYYYWWMLKNIPDLDCYYGQVINE